MDAAPLTPKVKPCLQLKPVLSVSVQGCWGENDRIHFYCTCSEPAERPSGERIFLPGQTDFQNWECPLTSAVIRAGNTLTGGVSSAVRNAVWHCSACVTGGDAHKTGKYASSSRFETGIQCFTSTSEALKHPPTVMTKQAVITDCDLAWLGPGSGGMYSALTWRIELNLHDLQ